MTVGDGGETGSDLGVAAAPAAGGGAGDPPGGTRLAAGSGAARELEAVYDIPVQVSAVLGRATLQVSQLLKLGRGAVVELDRKLGEAVDIYVNNRLIARGEVVMVDDNRLGVTMTEIVKADRGGAA
ncbi:flagellar motor switch protein FliN [Caldovatus aquaticus]|uniref:Flagellar motor switch protein FliN n=1 Tax=Caldovatus aquaticus TaxID=2865671 RepID=A0ABS7F502_9PROT|nr:flagellar motor switch protein FliN [Caldovatus aquaticus]MBW8270706.1 flagellar motor switch protein FliN [Caldovatus aquaticus]